jgi:hypothetical protein
MPNWCDISVVITADTPETKQFLESSWKEYRQDDSGMKDIFDYLQPDNSTRVEVFDEDYYYDDDGDQRLLIQGQSAWEPPFEFLHYLQDEKNLSVCCEYDERGMGFCGRWEGDDTLDEHYDYYDLLPDGWEEIQSLGDEDGDNYNLPDEPVWEKGELIKLESDNKPVYGIVLDCEPFEFNKPDLPDLVIDRGCLEFLDFLDDITIKKRVKIVMTGESRPESAVLYTDENGNNNLFVL